MLEYNYLVESVFLGQTKIGQSHVTREVVVRVRISREIASGNRYTSDSVLDSRRAKVRAIFKQDKLFSFLLNRHSIKIKINTSSEHLELPYREFGNINSGSISKSSAKSNFGLISCGSVHCDDTSCSM